MWKFFDLQRAIDRLFDEAWLSPWRLDGSRCKAPD